MSLTSDIREFHEKFGIDYAGPPRKLDTELLQFRVNFMKEELIEYIESATMADQLDALVDLTYIVLGTAHLQGFPFQEAWDRVHAANMQKVKGQSERSDKFDVIKPEGWTPPDLTDLVGEQMELFNDNSTRRS
tara:strand:+ start:4051 stop:4449 length:399 start_codon:yes stop_codon:yes gene_type:complete